MSPFPTEYQLEQIGRLVLVDRTRPWMLEKYFDAQHFRIINQPITQEALFSELCAQLKAEGYVDDAFLPSVVEREAIVSTMPAPLRALLMQLAGFVEAGLKTAPDRHQTSVGEIC